MFAIGLGMVLLIAFGGSLILRNRGHLPRVVARPRVEDILCLPASAFGAILIVAGVVVGIVADK